MTEDDFRNVYKVEHLLFPNIKRHTETFLYCYVYTQFQHLVQAVYLYISAVIYLRSHGSKQSICNVTSAIFSSKILRIDYISIGETLTVRKQSLVVR